MSVKAAFIKTMTKFDVSRSLAGHIYDALSEAGCIASNTTCILSIKGDHAAHFPNSPDALVDKMFQKDLLQSQQKTVQASHNHYRFSRHAFERHDVCSKKRLKLAAEDGRANSTSANANC